jgi:hypothetical protein
MAILYYIVSHIAGGNTDGTPVYTILCKSSWELVQHMRT